MSVAMTAKKGFANPRISGPRPDGSVMPGDSFTTDWLHGKELRQLGLAEPDDEKAFDAEPAELMMPHNQISEPELRRVNTRRAARGDVTGATSQVVTGDGPRTVEAPALGSKSSAPAMPSSPNTAKTPG